MVIERVEADGTRVYTGGVRYKPVGAAGRKYERNRPDDPRAVRFHAQWFLPLELLDDERRLMPETREDSEAYDHRAKDRACSCQVCQRPQAGYWKRKWEKDTGWKLEETPKERLNRIRRARRARRATP